MQDELIEMKKWIVQKKSAPFEQQTHYAKRQNALFETKNAPTRILIRTRMDMCRMVLEERDRVEENCFPCMVVPVGCMSMVYGDWHVDERCGWY